MEEQVAKLSQHRLVVVITPSKFIQVLRFVYTRTHVNLTYSCNFGRKKNVRDALFWKGK